MKFTNRVEFPMTIMILKDFRATYSPLIQHPSTISIDHLFQLARIFLKMPNLKHLKFVLTLEMPSPLTASEVLRYAASKSAWKKRLATIRSGFPAGCRSALVIKAEGRYDRPALEVLKIEKEFVTLASSIEGFDEVRQFSAEEGPYSVVPRLGLFLQTIHVNTA